MRPLLGKIAIYIALLLRVDLGSPSTSNAMSMLTGRPRDASRRRLDINLVGLPTITVTSLPVPTRITGTLAILGSPLGMIATGRTDPLLTAPTGQNDPLGIIVRGQTDPPNVDILCRIDPMTMVLGVIGPLLIVIMEQVGPQTKVRAGLADVMGTDTIGRPVPMSPGAGAHTDQVIIITATGPPVRQVPLLALVGPPGVGVDVPVATVLVLGPLQGVVRVIDVIALPGPRPLDEIGPDTLAVIVREVLSVPKCLRLVETGPPGTPSISTLNR